MAGLSMSTLFVGDPHLGHKNIHKFRNHVISSQHNDDLFLEQWRTHVKKKDIVFVLGDVVFDYEALWKLEGLSGRKILIKGNHDNEIHTSSLLNVFEEVHSMVRYKKMWLTHCPIHPDELRKCPVNIHGHVHNFSVLAPCGTKEDPRYINMCPEKIYPAYGKYFLSLEEIRDRVAKSGISLN